MADISMQYVAGIRQYLRINHTRFDAEITDLIGAARADLLLGGISEKKVNDESDALIKRAIVVYVKAEFGLRRRQVPRELRYAQAAFNAFE